MRELANEAALMLGVQADDPVVTAVALEGGRRIILSNRYERRPALRNAEIRIFDNGKTSQRRGMIT